MARKKLKAGRAGNIKIQIALILLSFVVFALRRPDAIIHAQFWAEDGSVWFARAYDSHYSLLTLITPYNGYVNLIAGLTAIMTWFTGPVNAPLLFAVTALAIQALPVGWLWSKGLDMSVTAKAAVTAVYLTVPTIWEMNATMTNAQWFLAILGFILIYIDEPRSTVLKFADYGMLALIGLSGPFCLLLLPLAFINHRRTRTDDTRIRLMILAVCAILQAALLVGGGRSTHVAIGFSGAQLLIIVGRKVFGEGLLGPYLAARSTSALWMCALWTLAGSLLLAYAFMKGSRLFRNFVAFGILILLAALSSPTVFHAGHTWWQALSVQRGYGRYFLLLHMAFWLGLIILVGWHGVHMAMRYVCLALLFVIVLTSVPSGFLSYPRERHGYRSKVQSFEASSRTEITLPINPVPWRMTLTK